MQVALAEDTADRGMKPQSGNRGGPMLADTGLGKMTHTGKVEVVGMPT